MVTGLQLCREIERQSLANLHILGSKMGDCAQTAVYHLSERREGDAKRGLVKYRCAQCLPYLSGGGDRVNLCAVFIVKL